MDALDFQELKNLRAKGKFEEATLLVAKAIKGKRPSAEALVELIKLMLLMGKPQVAEQTYRALSKMSPEAVIREPECGLRLQMVVKGRGADFESKKDFELLGGWTQELLTTGVDPVYPVKITECSLEFNDQQCGIYQLNCSCASCHSAFSITVSTSFLLYREFLCPLCLSRQVIDFENLRGFIDENLSFLMGDQVDRMDQALKDSEIELEDKVLRGGDELHFAEAFYLGSTILLNQVTLKTLLESHKKSSEG